MLAGPAVVDPIVVALVLGPSGAGKSTLGALLQKHLRLFHLELDVWAGDAIDREGLRREWNGFLEQGLAGPFANALRRRAHEVASQGIVATFPSPVVFSEAHLRAAEAESMQVLVLYGSGAECMHAFLEREAKLARGLDEGHWLRHNCEAYALFSLPMYARHRVAAFSKGSRRSSRSLLAEIKGRLTSGCN